MNFLLPPQLRNPQGDLRRVGLEIEFGGVSIEQTCKIIKDLFGGEIEKKHPFSYKVRGTCHGDFEVESDARFLSEKRYETYLDQIGLRSTFLVETVEKILSENLAGKILPYEIAMPPISLDRLHETDQIRKELFKHSAQGTRTSLLAAFGMQFNPEIPDLSAPTLLRYLRAFFLMVDWLQEESKIPLSRQLAPFIRPFPQAYVNEILDPNFTPNIDELISHYLKYNPTRNRPLDLLPLFTYINKDLVFQYPVEKDMIKPRPTFHYRLPNCEVDDPNWSIALEWNRWVQVEKLAFDEDQISFLSREYLKLQTTSLMFPRTEWITKVARWIHSKSESDDL